MSEWADLHGEWDSVAMPRKPSKNAKWCDNCQCWVERANMKRWSPDGTFIHFLCDGCDAEMDEPERVDE